jgi:acyl-CoA synthetase (AMP-forming)/AMP-acid ligase II
MGSIEQRSLLAPAATMSPPMSFVSGPTTPELWEESLGELILRQAARFGDHTAATFSWQAHHRLSYRDLAARSEIVAKALLARGLEFGDNIAIMAGNCYQYIETFLGAARIGCPLIVLNNTYSPKELLSAVSLTCELRSLENVTSPGADMMDSVQASFYRSEDQIQRPVQTYRSGVSLPAVYIDLHRPADSSRVVGDLVVLIACT